MRQKRKFTHDAATVFCSPHQSRTGPIVTTHCELSCYSIKSDMYGVFKIRRRWDLWSLFVSILFPTYMEETETSAKSIIQLLQPSLWIKRFRLASPFSAPERIDMIPFRCFLSSGTDGSGLVLWLAENESLPAPVPKMVLLIRTGGAGGLSSGSPLSHIVEKLMQPSKSGSGWRWWQTVKKGGRDSHQTGH